MDPVLSMHCTDIKHRTHAHAHVLQKNKTDFVNHVFARGAADDIGVRHEVVVDAPKRVLFPQHEMRWRGVSGVIARRFADASE